MYGLDTSYEQVKRSFSLSQGNRRIENVPLTLTPRLSALMLGDLSVELYKISNLVATSDTLNMTQNAV